MEEKRFTVIKYPKIQTLYKRDSSTKRNVIIPGDFSRLEFDNIKRWLVLEKIDGTNIRIGLNEDGTRSIGGRTDNAQIPAHLFEHLDKTFPVELLHETFNPKGDGTWPEVTIFGEGFGPKIQKGGGDYADSPSFRIFDIVIGNWWMNWEQVEEIAFALGVPTTPIIRADWDLSAIEPYVMGGFVSLVPGSKKIAEGVICRTDPYLFNRRGERVMFKLKVKDYEDLKNEGSS